MANPNLRGELTLRHTAGGGLVHVEAVDTGGQQGGQQVASRVAGWQGGQQGGLIGNNNFLPESFARNRDLLEAEVLVKCLFACLLIFIIYYFY